MREILNDTDRKIQKWKQSTDLRNGRWGSDDLLVRPRRGNFAQTVVQNANLLLIVPPDGDEHGVAVQHEAFFLERETVEYVRGVTVEELDVGGTLAGLDVFRRSHDQSGSIYSKKRKYKIATWKILQVHDVQLQYKKLAWNRWFLRLFFKFFIFQIFYYENFFENFLFKKKIFSEIFFFF